MNLKRIRHFSKTIYHELIEGMKLLMVGIFVLITILPWVLGLFVFICTIFGVEFND